MTEHKMNWLDSAENFLITIVSRIAPWAAPLAPAYLVARSIQDHFEAPLIVGIAAIIGSIIPLVPFFFLPVTIAMVASVLVAALVLFVVGAYKAHIYVGNPGKSGLEMAVIGTLSALVGYGVGMILRIPSTP